MCDCGKRIKHLLQERLDNLIEIEIDSKLAIDSGMENLFTHVRDSMVAGIDEHKISDKYLIKVRTFPCATCSNMYHYLVLILQKT